MVVEETNDNKWENPEESELELQLRSHLDSNKSDPAVNDPEMDLQLDLERLGDEGEECIKTATMPVGHCNENKDAEHWNEAKSPNNDVEKSRLSSVDPAEAEKEKKVETRKLKLDEIPEGSPEH